MTQRLMVISGGIGSGKSAVGASLARRGVGVIDADAVGHRVLEPDHPCHRRVAERWPEVVVDGRIDRRALGRIVFADPDALAELESITHPAIRDEIRREIEAIEMPAVAVELPFVRPFLEGVDVRLVVDAPDDVRRSRLRERGMQEDEIEARMAAQPSRDEWLASADVVVDNGGDLDDLEAEIDRVVALLVVRGDPDAP